MSLRARSCIISGITALLQRGQRCRQLLTDLLRLRTVFANGLAGALRAQPAINSLVSCSTIDSACTAAALRCAVMLNNVLQIVDAVEVGVSQFADLWFNVARDGDIHQQHRLVTARLSARSTMPCR